MRNLTIMMSTYNGEKFVEKQLSSIYSQILPNDIEMRLYVRDDGSIDKTIQILETWKDKLDITITKGKNVGARESFYWLIMNAPDSDYYAFCDQDDIWNNDKIKKALFTLTTRESLYFSNVSYIDENDDLIGQQLLDINFEFNLRRVFMCNPANGCTMLWDKYLHSMLHKINYNKFTMHDEYVCTIAAVFGNVFYDNRSSMLYRIHSSNVTQSKDLKKKIKIWKEVWFGRKQYSIADRAQELLKYEINDNDTKELLIRISTYKKGINRFVLPFSLSCEDKSIQRSLRIRMMLGLA